jgi:general secretion pathway protein I
VRRSPQDGFSLLEVLVAFAILAIILGVLLQIFTGSAQRATLAESYLKATSLAEARLNEIGREAPLTAGGLEGQTEDGFAWGLQVEPYPIEGLDSPVQSLVPMRVRVVVAWQEQGRRHEVSATTLRAVLAQP